MKKPKTDTDEIKIEKGIPIPPDIGSRGKWKDVLFAMKDGDSILVGKSAYYPIKQCAYLQGINIIRRLEDGKYRIWKTGIKVPLNQRVTP